MHNQLDQSKSRQVEIMGVIKANHMPRYCGGIVKAKI